MGESQKGYVVWIHKKARSCLTDIMRYYSIVVSSMLCCVTCLAIEEVHAPGNHQESLSLEALPDGDHSNYMPAYSRA